MNAVSYNMERDEQKNRAISALITLVLMLGMYASLRLLWLHYPDPPPPPVIEEIEILLGTPDGGQNSDYAELPAGGPVDASDPNQTSLNSDVDETPAMATQTTPNTTPNTTPSTVRTFNTNGRDVNGGIGDGGQPGNQGAPDGSPTGDPHGRSGGKGTMKRKTKEVYRGKTICSQSGKVMVQFTVDKSGKVIKTKAIREGSTIDDRTCWKEAEENAKKWVFEADADAPEFETGVLPVHFVVK